MSNVVCHVHLKHMCVRDIPTNTQVLYPSPSPAASANVSSSDRGTSMSTNGSSVPSKVVTPAPPEPS